MRRRTQGSEPREPRAPALEARGTAGSQPSRVHPLHWLYLTFLLLGVVLWTSVPAFAAPGHTPMVADHEAHATPGETPDHCPARREGGERGEVEVIEDERDAESDDERDLLTKTADAEISALSLAADHSGALGWIDRLPSPRLTGSASIRGPPGPRSSFMSI